MTWVNLSAAFGYGTKLTSSNMQQLRDNIAAAFAKDSGSPELATDYVKTIMVTDANITNAKLKTAVGTYTGNIDPSVGVAMGLHDYCFFPSIYGAVADKLTLYAQAASSSDTVARFVLYNTDTQVRAYDVDWRYVTASDEPFIFALIDKTTEKGL